MADNENVDKVSFKSPYYDGLDARNSQKFDLPDGLMKAIRVRGEASNADQVSEAGARSVYQIIPSTRDLALKKYGIDAYLSPENAAEVAARLVRDSLDRNGNSAPLAVAEYKAGTDRANWEKWGAAPYTQRVTGQKISTDGNVAPKQSTFDRVVAKSGMPQESALTNIYKAYKDGAMSPEDRKQFESDVREGRVMLPRGALLAPGMVTPKAAIAEETTTKKTPDAPEGVVRAWQDQAMTPSESAEFEKDVREGRISVPEAVKKQIGPDPGTLSRATDATFEAVSGARRETEETRTLPDAYGAISGIPELAQSSRAGIKAAIGSFFANPTESVKILQSQFPGLKARQDDKGNYILTSSIDGKDYVIKPGFQVSDIPKAAGTVAAFTPAGKATTILGAAGKAAATQAVIEGSQAATGGDFNPGEVAVAGAGGAVAPVAARVIEAAMPPVVKAIDAVKGTVRGRMGGAASEAAPLEGEYIPAGSSPAPVPALPAPASTPILPAPTNSNVNFVVGKDGIARAVRSETPTAATPTTPVEKSAAPVAPTSPAPVETPTAAPTSPAAAESTAGAAPTAETVPPAAEPVAPIAPEMTIPAGKSAEELAVTARKAAGGSSSAKQALAEEVRPDPETLAAAERLGIQDHLQPDHVTTNQGYRTLAATLKSVPGSEMAAAEREGLTHVAQRADEVISELGGSRDLSLVDASLLQRMTNAHRELKDAAKSLFSQVAEIVKPSTPVTATNLISNIRQHAANLGGEQYLSAGERDLLKTFGAEAKPTYLRLDEARKDMNAAIYGKQNAFATTGEARLKQIGQALALDQVQAAHAAGVGGIYEAAQATSRQYLGMQKDLTALFGKQLTNSVVAPLANGVKNLGKGDVSGLVKMLQHIPAEMRQEVVASGLTSAFDSVAQAKGNFNPFVNWYEGLARNTQARNLLFVNLPHGAPQRLADLYRVMKGITASKNQFIGTGRLLAAPVKGILEADNMMAHIFNVARKAGAAEAVTSTIGLPGTGLAGAVGAAVMKGRTPVIKAADALINSPEFKAAAMSGFKGPAMKRFANSSKAREFLRKAGVKANNPEQWFRGEKK